MEGPVDATKCICRRGKGQERGVIELFHYFPEMMCSALIVQDAYR